MPDWHQVFGFQTPALEIFARGTVVYLFIFALLRIVLKREIGQLGVADVLVLVLIADAAQNGMAGSYTSVPDGLILVATIVFWAWLIDLLTYKVAWIERLVHPRPRALVREGKMQPNVMRSEFMTVDELARQLRMQGIDDISNVKLALIEGDGRVSVIPNGDAAKGNGSPERPLS